MISVTCEIIVRTGETNQRLELLHGNVRKYGTTPNTVAQVVCLQVPSAGLESEGLTLRQFSPVPDCDLYAEMPFGLAKARNAG